MKRFKSWKKKLRKSTERFLNDKKGKNRELITCVRVHFCTINRKPVHRMFRPSKIISTNHEISNQLKFQSCFGIGWSLKFPSHCTGFLIWCLKVWKFWEAHKIWKKNSSTQTRCYSVASNLSGRFIQILYASQKFKKAQSCWQGNLNICQFHHQKSQKFYLKWDQ